MMEAMDLPAALDSEHSKAQTLRITDWVGTNQGRFESLLAILRGTDGRRAQRAAWVISHLAERHPQFVQPHLPSLLENLRRPGLHDAVKRNTLKAATELETPDELAGLVADLSFSYLISPEEAVAVKVHALTLLERLCHREPELAGEVRLAIEQEQRHQPTPAFRSKARQVLQSLDRIAPSS